MFSLIRRFLGSSTVERLDVSEAIAELVPSEREKVIALLTTGKWEPPTNYIRAEVVGKAVVSDALAAATHRDQMARERARDIDLNRTAYPMRGRFHCCDPRTVQSYNVDTGEARMDAVCELCGWSFQSQTYPTGPDAPPPPSADCHEPGATKRLT